MKSNLLFGAFLILSVAGVVVWGELPDEHTDHYAVLLDNRKIGYAIEERSVKGNQVTTRNTMKLTISRMGVPVTVQQVETHVETKDGKPIRFETVQDMSIMRMESQGTIKNGKLKLSSTTMGQTQEQEIPWPEGALLAEGLRLKTLAQDFSPGSTFSIPTYQPSLLTAVNLNITVGEEQEIDLLGRVVKLTEVRSRYLAPTGEMKSTTYVNKGRRPEKSIIPVMGFNIEMIHCAKEYALSEIETVDLLDEMLVKSPQSLKDVHKQKSATYVLRPKTANARIPIPETDNQTLKRQSNGSMRLTVHPRKPKAGITFPYKGRDPKLLEALEATPFLQSDHPKIKQLAQQAIAGAKDTAQAVQRIEAFVADYIDSKDLAVGYATAIEVCESRQGDCTEHAVLTAALCRAVGIPAQVVVGIAYVESFAGRSDVFGGHAWTQAYIGDQWIGLDAAFKGTGRHGYGPGHIALGAGNGGPGDFFGTIGALGLFEVESVSVER